MGMIPFLSPDSRATAGMILLTIVAVEYGSLYLLPIGCDRQCDRRSMTEFQRAFARAGHAHAAPGCW